MKRKIILFTLALLISGTIGHFVFPRQTTEVIMQLNKQTTFNELHVTLTPSTGTITITGFNGENLWLGRITDTDSMFPTMRDGMALIETTNTTSIKPRDIIVFNHPATQYPVVHRVISIGEDNDGWFAETLADNKNTPNGQIPFKIREQDIFGKVRAYFDY